jgi:hypothetical protein
LVPFGISCSIPGSKQETNQERKKERIGETLNGTIDALMRVIRLAGTIS